MTFFTTYLAKTKPSSRANNKIMTIREIANYLKVTKRTVYQLASVKKTPSFRVGGNWRFLRSDIDERIKEQTSVKIQKKLC